MKRRHHDLKKESRLYTIYDAGRMRKRKRYPKWVILLGGIFLVFVIAAVIVNLPPILIHTIRLSGAETIEPSLVTDEVQSAVGGYSWLVVPERNIFFYPEARVKSSVLRAFPRIASVSVKPASLTALLVSITERKQEYLWCSGDDTCYYMDANGYVFDRAPTFSGNVYFEFRSMATSSPIGRTVLSSAAVAKIVAFRDELNKMFTLYGEKQVGTIARVEVRSDGDYEFVILRADKKQTSWKLIFSKAQAAETLLDTIDTALTSIVNGKNGKKSLADLEYMDVRFGRKLFYKFVGE